MDLWSVLPEVVRVRGRWESYEFRQAIKAALLMFLLLNHKETDGSYSFSGLPSGTYTLYTSDGSGTLNTSTVTVSGSYTLDAPANGFAVLDPQ